jgi:nucleotide-binding universal stress UspA family protein
VDGSAQALAATRVAAREALLLGATLRIVHAWPEPNAVFPGMVGVPHEINPQPSLALAEHAIDAAVVEVRAISATLPIERAPICGDPAHVLADVSAEARMLVVGSRGRGDLASLVLGSVSHGCLHRAGCPVMVVHSEGTPDGPVVVGTDGSERSQRAVLVAADEAQRRQKSLAVVHTWRVPVGAATGSMAGAVPLDPAPIHEAAESVIAEAITAATAAAPGVAVSGRTHEGDATHAIVEAAAGASLIVVGSKRRGDLAALLAGSVGHMVLHEAGAPVLFVP